jgi:hypothetical protein
MNAVMLMLALVLPGQTYVYQARPAPELSPEVKAQHAKALAQLRRADRYDQIARMTRDVEIRLEWARDKQQALVETLGFESNRGTWGKAGEFRDPDPQGLRIAWSVAGDPRVSALEEFRAMHRELVRVEKQNRTLAGQRHAVRYHLDREAQRRAGIEAAKAAGAIRARGR